MGDELRWNIVRSSLKFEIIVIEDRCNDVANDESDSILLTCAMLLCYPSEKGDTTAVMMATMTILSEEDLHGMDR